MKYYKVVQQSNLQVRNRMKHITHSRVTLFAAIIFIGATIGIMSCTDSQNQEPDKTVVTKNLLFLQGEKITNANFTGTAYLKMLVEADSINPTAVGNVTFEPGARTKWHYHPAGQILLVIDGVGYYQEKGQSKKILHKGDVVKCPPNTPHWHGASADKAFIQVAVTNNHRGSTVWLQEVTDEEYHAAAKQ
jgi:quercetin dioxygenase-like cupin family protein